jgi:hypothetical protein
MLARTCADTLGAMHTCLTLTNIGRRWYVEREVSGLISSIRSYCDSIHSCDISVEGPSGEGQARCWRVDLRIRVFDEILRITERAPESDDPQQALSRVLAAIRTRATAQLAKISAQHGDSCTLCA